MAKNNLEQRFHRQKFSNEYELTDGVAMHAANGDNFQISPAVIKRHIKTGQFVELRIDSPRFSIHEETAEKCTCPSCNGEMTKPILRHEHPASLMPLPDQKIPSRGWGEDFWVRVSERDGDYFLGIVDNSLAESRLHELRQGDTIMFHEDQILAVHNIHRAEIVMGMGERDLIELVEWIKTLKE